MFVNESILKNLSRFIKNDNKYFYYKKRKNKTQYKLEDIGDWRIMPNDIYSTLIYLTNEYYYNDYGIRWSELNIKEQEKLTINKLNSNIYNSPDKNTSIITKECIDCLLYIMNKHWLALYWDINKNDYSTKYKIENLKTDINEYINWKYKWAYKIIKNQTIWGFIMIAIIIILLII